MVVNNIDVIIRTLYKRTGLKASVKDLNRLQFTVRKSGQVVDSMTGKFVKTNDVMRGLGKQVGRFKMGWLSVMFAAMLVNRIMMNLFKNMRDTFKKVGGKMHPLNIAMTRLEASFTYLKYSIMEAVGPLLEKFLIWIADLAVWISDLDPGVLKAIAIGLAAIGAVAGIALVGAQLALLFNGVKGLTGGKILMAFGPGGWLIAGLAALAAIGVIAIFKDPKKIEILKDIFRDMKPALDAVVDAFWGLWDAASPSNLASWDKVGWTGLWIIDVLANITKSLLYLTATFINFGEGAFDAMKLAWYAVTFQWEKGEAVRKRLHKTAEGLFENFMKFGFAMEDAFKTLGGGPESFRKNKEAMQELTSATNRQDEIFNMFNQTVSDNVTLMREQQVPQVLAVIDSIGSETTAVDTLARSYENLGRKKADVYGSSGGNYAADPSGQLWGREGTGRTFTSKEAASRGVYKAVQVSSSSRDT